ncbi:MAG: NBR1-Ig-like domain-containing protein [Chloroflexota bacterium]
MRRQVVKLFVLFLFAFLISTPGCSVFSNGSRPSVVIVAPPSGSEFYEGEEIAVQSESSDSVGIVRVELVVDDKIVRTDAPSVADNKTAFLLNQVWRASPGKHVLLVRAYNAAGGESNPAAVSVSVLPGPAPTATAAPISVSPTVVPVSASPTITPTISASCSDSAVFVADVTVPDGTPWMPGQAFNKIWRVRNTGCPWGTGYQLVFVSGEAMATTRAIPLPETASGATADLLVAMTAPTAPGAHNGTWRLRNPNGVLFGTVVTVKINVLGQAGAPKTAAPVACSGTPVISSFTASKTIVTALSTTTLTWGPVTNADWVEINPDIGGVATPGSATVAVTTTTTFTLLAFCGPSTSTNLQVRVLVPFAVLGSAVSADVTDYSGACPKTVNFSGVITVNDAGPVTYRWESSDGSNSGDITINFSGAGSQTVSSTWTLGASGTTYTDYWRRLHISSPTDVTSNHATFTLRCN